MHPLTAEVAIIGAGTAGCFIASLFDEADIDCLLIEKSRGVGGRCNRRRVGTDYEVDLGAPEFSLHKATHPLLKQKIEAWSNAGFLSTWTKSASCFDTHIDDHKMKSSWCASPSMSAWHKNIAGHINILTQSRVLKIERIQGQWQLFDDCQQLIAVANKLVITSPPEQAIDLLNTVDEFNYSATLPVESLPQYVCAIGFTEALKIKSDAYEGGHAQLYRAIRETSKPGRSCAPSMQEVWLVHSTHQWAQAQCHTDSASAATQLTQAFCQHFDIQAQAHILTSHYWRMSRYKAVPQDYPPFIWDETLQVGCCGDWLGRSGTLGALNSALALHHAIMGN